MRLRYLLALPLVITACQGTHNTRGVTNTTQTTAPLCSAYTGPILPGDDYHDGIWVRDGRVFGYAAEEDEPINTCPDPAIPVCFWEDDEAIRYEHSGAVAPPADAERVYCPTAG